MKTKVFAVYDSAVGAYMKPVHFNTRGEALRTWLDLSQDDTCQFKKHPADFTLFEIAEYNEETGRFENLHTPLSLGSILEMQAKAGNAPLPRDGLTGVGDPPLAIAPPAFTAVKDRIKKAVENHSERNV